jgi:SRSO17 transposase
MGVDRGGPSMTELVVAAGVQERLADFVAGCAAGMEHPRQRVNAELYVRGLLEAGSRKSLQPTLFRLGVSTLTRVDASYQSVQQFIADSPWSADELTRACAERVAPQLELTAWIVDDTGFAKDGRHSPGVKRQYSGTLGKIGNCQIAVSLHAVGRRGTLPMGWRLYLPEDWCDDLPRRRKTKIPDHVVFRSKPQLAAELIEQAARWEVPAGPVLADQAYGEDTLFRERLDAARMGYVVAVSARTSLFGPETAFAVPPPPAGGGQRPYVFRADRPAQSAEALARSLPPEAFRTLPCGTTPAGVDRHGRFALLRVYPAHRIKRHARSPRAEWLIIEWPTGAEGPSDYWLSNLPADTHPEELVRLARLRWTIELDYRQLKGELGLDHYEGRSWAGFHHHCALVSCAHAFLTEERLRPPLKRPA